jgi:AcrR family transcriptional regulator
MSEASRKRGRPRAYDPDAALARARDVFWDAGFAGSSLDSLGAAMTMNRPSLYSAFGDKEALYLRTLERYRDESLVAIRQALDPGRSLRAGLGILYATALSTYLDGEAGARGCLLIGTAAVEAVLHPAVREALGGSLAAFDQALEERFRLARDRGEIDSAADVTVLALLASAVLHSLAVRARAGDSRTVLEAIAESGIGMICAAAGAR